MRVDDRHARAMSFERDVLRRVVGSVTTLPFGEGMLAPDFDRVWDVNLVNVEHGRRPSADDVMSAADELLGPMGFTHRTARYEDGDAMDEVEDAFLAAGYQRNSWIVLALEGTPPATATGTARKLTLEEFDNVNTRLTADRPWGADDHEVAMFVRLGRRFLDVGGGEVVGAFDDRGAPAGAARVYGTGPVRQVEEVEVVGSQHGRGLGRDLMHAALHLAVQGDPELVFVVADEDDWPLGWYERLGFVRIGRAGSFQRKPPGTT